MFMYLPVSQAPSPLSLIVLLTGHSYVMVIFLVCQLVSFTSPLTRGFVKWASQQGILARNWQGSQ